MASIIDAVRTSEVFDVLNVIRSQLHTLRMEPVEKQLHQFNLQAKMHQVVPLDTFNLSRKV